MAIQINQSDVRADVHICYQQWTFTYVWELWIDVQQYTVMVVAVDWFDADRKLRKYFETNLKNQSQAILERINTCPPRLISNAPTMALVEGAVCITEAEVPVADR